MNTHDIELPPLPDWFAGYSSADKHVVQAFAYAAIEADRKRRGEPVDIRQEVIETLEMILAADWRKWEELASPDEFVRWAKSRANYALSIINEAPPPAEPVNEEELLAARDALVDMGYLWDGDQWVEVDPPSKAAEQAPEWPDFARMEASLQRLKERLVFENSRRNDLEQKLREKRNGG